MSDWDEVAAVGKSASLAARMVRSLTDPDNDELGMAALEADHWTAATLLALFDNVALEVAAGDEERYRQIVERGAEAAEGHALAAELSYMSTTEEGEA